MLGAKLAKPLEMESVQKAAGTSESRSMNPSEGLVLVTKNAF